MRGLGLVTVLAVGVLLGACCVVSWASYGTLREID